MSENQNLSENILNRELKLYFFLLEQENKFTIGELKLIQNTVNKLFYINSYYSRNNLVLNEKYENALKVVEVNDCESNQKSSKRISHKKSRIFSD